MLEIVGFSGEYRWLSNFYPSPIQIGEDHAPTVEHAYQASKCKDPHDAAVILECPTPGQAKRLGRYVTMVTGFDEIKRRVMLHLVRLKFQQNPELAAMLKATGHAELVEENNWGDRYWGTCQRVGENHLGKILMQVRSEL